MKYHRVYLFLLLQFIDKTKCYGTEDVKVERLYPKGFRLSIPVNGRRDVFFVRFYVNINSTIPAGEDPDYTAIVRQPTNERWIYDNIHDHTPAGTVIYYFLGVKDRSGRVISTNGRVRKAILPTETVPLLNKESCEAIIIHENNCPYSITTVNRKPVCKGELIFEENFSILDSKVWKNEVRVPLENEGSPFVSYQNRSENCYVKNGQLHIVPSLLSNVSGFNESMIRTGSLQLQGCTPIDDESKECVRKARFAQILPPIVSAKITTKDSFSFRYGKIVIRAKMPKGDWIVPLMLLDPSENYYGYTGYASGQLRLAHMHGNEFLRTRDGEDISRRIIRGGPVLSSLHPLYDIMLRKYPDQRDFDYTLENYYDFHYYTLTWTDNFLKFEIDDAMIAILPLDLSQVSRFYNLPFATRWKYGDKMAPFDKELFLTLGVSVGGHHDFPDGCRNGDEEWKLKPWNNSDPKAELNFWKDRSDWIKTWNGSDTGLHIDFIRVHAL